MHRRDFLNWGGRVAAIAAVTPPARGLAQTNAPAAAAESAVATRECDVFVYGSTSGGVAAAIEAARRGCSVVLACPKMHPGGMPASGLSTTDVRQKELYGGFVTEFIAAVRDDYLRTLGESSPDWPLVKEGWFYEPRVAERVFDRLLAAQPTLQFWRGHHLVSARVEGGQVRGVELDAPRGQRVRLTARTFIDCTYEGDLAAAAGVPYRVGREGRAEHGESLAGIFYMDHKKALQPLDVPGMGAPSHAIQAYCARSIFTTDRAKFVPVEKPASYEVHRTTLLPLIDDIAGGLKLRTIGAPLPGKKYQMNGQISLPTSINCPGVSWGWPEADRAHRAVLERFHVEHAASYIWFLQNEPRVPSALREFWRTVGLHRDEFTDNGHWPWQIYVRQARRIEGRALVTQHNFVFDEKQGRTPNVKHAIAIADYMFDVHPCQDRRSAVDGFLEGVIWYPNRKGLARAGQVPFGAMVPRKLDNLLVPVALSSTHVGMSVLRMEPVWMTTGQIAGLAAAEAKAGGFAVASIDPAPLPAKLGLEPDPWGKGLVTATG
jgi:hypothetical protein